MCGNDSREGFICLNIIVNETAKILCFGGRGSDKQGLDCN